MARHEKWELAQMQSLSLDSKIQMTIARLRVWIDTFGSDGVYVSFSGGKDSTVLLDIVRNRMGQKDIPAVFVDTGLEYPEIREFVKSFDNVVWLKPKMNFKQVIEKYGYPFISKKVSEKVMYARLYIKRLIESNEKELPYVFAIMDLLGLERRKDENSEIKRKLKNAEIKPEDLDYLFSVESGAPMKAKALFGSVLHKEKGVLTSEISKMYDYSKWKYLVLAPFNISNQCCLYMKKKSD